MENEKQWHTLSIEESVKDVDVHQGLSESEAKERLTTFGYNQLDAAKKKNFLMTILDQFKDVMIIILIIAAVISGLLGEVVDAAIIMAIVIVNAILGYIQEAKAENALKALEDLSAPTSRVLRGGEEKVITKNLVVPGDILILETGDLVNADMRLIKTSSLQIQEASLTGESVPVTKDASKIITEKSPLGDRLNMAYASGQVTYGRGIGLVTATGMKTEVGRIATMLSKSETELTPLQKQLNQLGKVLGIVAILACGAIFIVGVLEGKEPFEMFLTAVSLAVAIIPESLPTVSTIVLALGVSRMVERNAIIKTLPSVETLGSTTVICSDKTGTLTQNKMKVVRTWISNDQHLEQLALANRLCNDSRQVDGVWVGDPTETALAAWANESISEDVFKRYPRIAEVPFDSGRKRMTTVHNFKEETLAYIKGGVDEILNVSTYILDNGNIRAINDEDKKIIHQQNQTMAEDALRVLAAAFKEVNGEVIDGDVNLESDAVFIGLTGMIDPPRPEVTEAIVKCKQAGIDVVMITGDHALTAKAIGREIGLLTDDLTVISGVDLDAMSDDQLFEQVKSIGVYARVSPEHKMRIIAAWKRHGDIVAMTGDGVNDAPALKKADIGAAMGIVGTEVAKSAADMVLTDDNFATVVAAVEEGRRIRDNITKAISYLLSCNAGELFVLLLAVVLNWPLPLLAIHILWINLVTDSLPALALGVDPAQEGIMSRKPDTSKSLMGKSMVIRILLGGTMIGAVTTAAFLLGNQINIETGRTMAFSVLGFSQLFYSLYVHSGHMTLFKSLLTNKYLWLAIIVNMAMMFGVLLIPPIQSIFKLTSVSLEYWGWIMGLALLPLLLFETGKLVFNRTAE
jgi:P-type Ca2+ transporter type 2C